MHPSSQTPVLSAHKMAFIFPRGSGQPNDLIHPDSHFVVVDDSEVGRDMMDLAGPGGPEAFDIDLPQAIAARGGTKGLALIGPRESLAPELHERFVADPELISRTWGLSPSALN